MPGFALASNQEQTISELCEQNFFVTLGYSRLVGRPQKSTFSQIYRQQARDQVKNGGIFQLNAMKTEFRTKYGQQEGEKTVSFRSEVTKELYFDLARNEKKLKRSIVKDWKGHVIKLNEQRVAQLAG